MCMNVYDLLIHINTYYALALRTLLPDQLLKEIEQYGCNNVEVEIFVLCEGKLVHRMDRYYISYGNVGVDEARKQQKSMKLYLECLGT